MRNAHPFTYTYTFIHTNIAWLTYRFIDTIFCTLFYLGLHIYISIDIDIDIDMCVWCIVADDSLQFNLWNWFYNICISFTYFTIVAVVANQFKWMKQQQQHTMHFNCFVLNEFQSNVSTHSLIVLKIECNFEIFRK